MSPAVSLLDEYHRRIKAHSFQPDPRQIQVVRSLQNLHTELRRPRKESESILPRWLTRRRKTPKAYSTQGAYLWGSVGCGKTFILDLFFESLPTDQKRRLHFHQFMNRVHEQLNLLKNQSQPLENIARTWANRVRLLYLDEFYVADIGDAMILAELIKQLFARNVILVASSNCRPQDLYANGLQRERFLPTIDLLTRYMEVIHLDSDSDYRLSFLAHKGLYNTPSDAQARATMEHTFEQLLTGEEEHKNSIEIHSRTIQTIRNSGNIAWFAFDEICGLGRSTRDYLEIAQCYQIVMVSDVPVFSDQDDLARRFINMIDTFYDKNVIFICSAQALPSMLYQKGYLASDFRRTASRLTEMHSESYLTQGRIINEEAH